MASESALFTGAETAELRISLGPLYESYLALQVALAADDLPAAKTTSQQVSKALSGVVATGLPLAAEEVWRWLVERGR